MSEESATKPGRPNILFVFPDQMGATWLGCYGSPDVQTPNIDRFAGEGMLFEWAYTASPICAPFRGTLFTGRYPKGCVDFDLEGTKLVFDQMAAEAGVDVLYHTFLCDTLTKDNGVVGGIVQIKSGRGAILAHRVMDCTGDGDVAFHEGAAFEQGRPKDGRSHPCTLMFTIGGVDWPRVAAWRGTDYQLMDVWAKAQADGIMEPFQDQIMGWWHTDVLPDQVGVNMTRLVDVDTTNTRDLNWATVEGRRQAHHLVEVFRQVVPCTVPTVRRLTALNPGPNAG